MVLLTDQELAGIDLEKELKKNYPNVSISNDQVKRIVLTAKERLDLPHMGMAIMAAAYIFLHQLKPNGGEVKLKKEDFDGKIYTNSISQIKPRRSREKSRKGDIKTQIENIKPSLYRYVTLILNNGGYDLVPLIK